jgi:voltage-gated potassium channel
MLNSSFRRIVTGIILFPLTVVTAVMGYMVAGWNFLDTIYMVVITIFGVGYGEVQPLTSPTLRYLRFL